MAKEAKTVKTFRLSASTQKELEQLAKRHSISQADVLAVLVHCNFMGFDEDTTNEWFELAARI